MNRLRLVCIASIAALVAACSAAPSKPQAPAVINVSGDWMARLVTPLVELDMNMTLAQTGKVLTGSLDRVDKTKGIHVDCSGTAEGNEIRLAYLYAVQGFEMQVHLLGVIENGAMRGRMLMSTVAGDALAQGSFTAERR